MIEIAYKEFQQQELQGPHSPEFSLALNNSSPLTQKHNSVTEILKISKTNCECLGSPFVEAQSKKEGHEGTTILSDTENQHNFCKTHQATYL